MTAIVEEAWDSRDAEIGENATASIHYYVLDEPNEIAAHLAAVTAAPLFYRSMPARGSRIKMITPGVFLVECQYGLDSKQTEETDPATSSFNTTLTFNLVGGTKHITTAIDTRSYAVAASPVDVKKVIGLDLKTGQVRGVDVFAPVMDYTLSTQFKNSVMTTAFIDDLFDLTGKINDAPFKGRPEKSVLFKGARGSKRGQELWEVGFEFAYSPNETDITINGINFDKKGWEYIDVMFKEDSTQNIGGKAMQVPAQVNVHEVFKSGDFSKLKIGVT